MGIKINSLLQFIFFFLFWIALSGRFDALSLFLGIGSCLFVLWLNRDLLKKSQVKPSDYILFWARILTYTPWLIKEIFMATLHVMQIILSPKMNINPSFKQYRCSLSSDVLKVIFANTITLTPGTITADIQDDLFTIYAIDDASAEGILNGSMESKIFDHFKLGIKR